MGPLKQVEDGLEGVFKAAPPMPENGKKSLVQYFPIIALVFGVLQAISFFMLWRDGHRVNQALGYLNEFSKAFGGSGTSYSLGITYWLALVALGISGALLLLAYPGLKAKKKAGWDWLFLGTIVNLVFGVIAAFDDFGGAGKLISAVVGSAISFYLLFQVRSYYTGGSAAKKA